MVYAMADGNNGESAWTDRDGSSFIGELAECTVLSREAIRYYEARELERRQEASQEKTEDAAGEPPAGRHCPIIEPADGEGHG